MSGKRGFLSGIVTAALALAMTAAMSLSAMAATLYISEFSQGVSVSGSLVSPILPQPSVADQVVTFTTTTQSSAFNAATHAVMLVCSADCSVRFGTNPTATTSNLFLAAKVPFVFGVAPGSKVAVVANP